MEISVHIALLIYGIRSLDNTVVMSHNCNTFKHVLQNIYLCIKFTCERALLDCIETDFYMPCLICLCIINSLCIFLLIVFFSFLLILHFANVSYLFVRQIKFI